MTATQLEALVELLAGADVEFVVVGGLAAVVHGSAYVTNKDLLLIPELEALLELRQPPGE